MNSIAETVVLGRIATLAGDRGWGWVEGIAIGNGRVLAAGPAEQIHGLTGPRTRTLRLASDEVAIPGLTDAHLHLADTAKEASEVDLANALTLEAGLALIADRHRQLPAGAWLEGRGWSADRWGRWPTSEDLATAAPGRLVAIWQFDHHATWCSFEALAAARVSPGTPDPSGGVIRRDEHGGPTGVLMERAAGLVIRRIDPPPAEQLAAGIPEVADELVSLGVVAVHDPAMVVLDPRLERAFVAYARLAERGRLPIRVHVSIREQALPRAIELGIRSGDPLGRGDHGRAHVGWLKLFADGTLGSRTAAMLEPYEPAAPGAGNPTDARSRGLYLTAPEILRELAAQSADAGIACQIHAIGDGALRSALDALEPTAGRTALAPRVEHAQIVDPADLPRFARARIAASVQPCHLRGDAAAARTAWGSRAERSGYPWASLASSGALLPFGTDAPVEPPDPWPGIAMAVTRRDPSWPADTAPFGPPEALPLERAIRAACVDGPLSAGEDDRGRLVAGHRADIAILPAEALSEPVEPGGPLATARPRRVLIDGEVVFER